ncbi:Uncharacterised protein [Klebsiella pneumoniae]|nr:Uncharacterised protein [Klebsiella pneumoniae]
MEHLVANLRHLYLAGNLFLRHFFGLSAYSAFVKIFCGDKAMHCLHFANINRGLVVSCPLHQISHLLTLMFG